MEVVPFVHEGLGNSSYLVGVGEGTAFLVDPDRSAHRYLQAAEGKGWRIEAVFETHLHADFLTGALEIANATGARIHTPAGAAAKFPHRPVNPGDHVDVLNAQVEAIASPGHTPEHVSYVLRAAGEPPVLFSGGALIVGGAARTDLIAPELTEALTRAEFRTLRNAFSALDDETLLYPTHGGGSFCSTGSGGERTSTLGRERSTNPLLAIRDEDEFARWFPTTFPTTPSYFSRMRPINQAGPRLRAEIADPPSLTPAQFDRASTDALIVDVRPIEEYAAGHIRGSLSNMFRSSFATWLGWLVPLGTPLLFVTNRVSLEHVLEESLLVGHERFAGVLEGGIAAWRDAGLPLASIGVVDAPTAEKAIRDGATVLDVREESEFASGHVEGAIHVPLGELSSRLNKLPKGRPVVTYCGMGERSASASSLLERAGFNGIMNLRGGVRAWRKAGYELA